MQRNTRRFLPCIRAVLSICLLLSGCATVPKQVEREPSLALENIQSTSLGRLCDSHSSVHAGLSGFSLLNEGRSAFLARTALADLAEHSLDVQYFIWKPDRTGSILVAHLVEAAKRGVRVRLLIDDYYGGGYGFGLKALDAYPNIEVRLYNPFGKHLLPRLGRSLEFVFSFRRLNHRMHNKLFIADNQVALIGGRNIADPYFGADSAFNFRDFDLFSVGPIVQEISKSFDEYWNSVWAIPLRAMHRSRPSAHEVAEAVKRLKSYIAEHPEYPYPSFVDVSENLESIGRLCNELLWAKARVASDSPGKSTENGAQQITPMLEEFLGKAKQEILIVTPYFVPSDPVVLKERLEGLRSRGIAIRMLTNSLGSTDLAISHVGYAKCRKLLVQSGVELYEMNPYAASREIYSAAPGPASVLGLHGKAALVDRTLVFIGTFNFDQRSANINTEVGLLIHSPELAQRIASAVAVDLQGQNSWRVSVAGDCDPSLEGREGGQDLVWIAEENGRRACLHREPSAGFKRLFLRSFMGLFPIESLL